MRKSKSSEVVELIEQKIPKLVEFSCSVEKVLQNCKYLYSQIPMQEGTTMVWKKPFFFKDSVERN